MYTYKTTLRVIRRFGGERRGWKRFSAPSQTESHEHLWPELLSMLVVCVCVYIMISSTKTFRGCQDEKMQTLEHFWAAKMKKCKH